MYIPGLQSEFYETSFSWHSRAKMQWNCTFLCAKEKLGIFVGHFLQQPCKTSKYCWVFPHFAIFLATIQRQQSLQSGLFCKWISSGNELYISMLINCYRKVIKQFLKWFLMSLPIPIQRLIAGVTDDICGQRHVPPFCFSHLLIHCSALMLFVVIWEGKTIEDDSCSWMWPFVGIYIFTNTIQRSFELLTCLCKKTH